MQDSEVPHGAIKDDTGGHTQGCRHMALKCHIIEEHFLVNTHKTNTHVPLGMEETVGKAPNLFPKTDSLWFRKEAGSISPFSPIPYLPRATSGGTGAAGQSPLPACHTGGSSLARGWQWLHHPGSSSWALNTALLPTRVAEATFKTWGAGLSSAQSKAVAQPQSCLGSRGSLGPVTQLEQ